MTGSGEEVFAFDVALSTHALLKAGVCEAAWSRVVVSGACIEEAALVAAQLAHTCHGHAMVTRVLVRI